MIWRPYLPEPEPAFVLDPGDPSPLPSPCCETCATSAQASRCPRARSSRKTKKGAVSGYYAPATDIVSVDVRPADLDGMGGHDGYYAVLVHELLHATGHPRRLARRTIGDHSPKGYALEEGTTLAAQRIVLAKIGFDSEALDWHAPSTSFPADHQPPWKQPDGYWPERGRATPTTQYPTCRRNRATHAPVLQPSTKGIRNRALNAVLWCCGLRIGEALALGLKNLDLFEQDGPPGA